MKTTNSPENLLTKAARIISFLTNPPALSVLLLFVISFTESGTMLTLAGWWVEVLIFLVLLPIVYIYIRIVIGKISLKLPTGIIAFLKQHPVDILVMGVIFGLPCLVILVLFKAPPLMYSTLAALLITSLIIASFYKFYRVSYHLAALTILVVMAAITWGNAFAWLAVLIPAAGWAKYRLQAHSPAQMVIAIVLSAVVTTITLLVIGIF